MTRMTAPGWPTCDNDCTRMGWVEALVSDGNTDLHISHPRRVDLDGTFAAFDHDNQQMIRINGWQMTTYTVIGETP